MQKICPNVYAIHRDLTGPLSERVSRRGEPRDTARFAIAVEMWDFTG